MRFAKGDRVFARVDKDIMGAFADYAVVHEDHAALMPASLDFLSAAAVPLAALTALQALRDELHLSTGQRVFIPGGAGGVGTFAIQIAKQLGAHVATTASPRGEALVGLGADVVIDWGARIRTWEWRNQNQLDYPTISRRIWKERPKHALGVSMA
jgi:NADPH:quinone reductase-like Zn-dependent oxidoreductase